MCMYVCPCIDIQTFSALTPWYKLLSNIIQLPSKCYKEIDNVDRQLTPLRMKSKVVIIYKTGDMNTAPYL